MQNGPSSLCKRGMQGVKRLRGVEIEKEKLKPGKKTFEKGKSSKLATALLSLWAHGKLSAATCRWLAEQAMLDGCTHPEVCDVAMAGAMAFILAMCTGISWPGLPRMFLCLSLCRSQFNASTPNP